MRQAAWKNRSRRGMTLPEIMIVVALFTLVGTFVASITLTVAKRSKESLSQIPAEQQAYRTMDFIRRGLLPAQFGTVKISDDGSSISFFNPMEEATATISFDSESKKCVYDPNVEAADDQLTWGRDIRGKFSILDSPKKVRVEVSTTAYDARDNFVRISYVDDLTIRN